jgi:hypothetical protein
MRSAAEIGFRLRQEFENLRLAAFPPGLPRAPGLPEPLLPPASEIRARLAGTRHAADIRALARSVLSGRLPILGTELAPGQKISWRRDPFLGIETPAVYFRRIPYLDPARAGDHKIIWELNRHQHLVLLAQSHALEPDPAPAGEIERQLLDWMRENPFQRGINWTSALEVAFRALSWTWILHLAGAALSAGFRDRLLEGLYRHGRHLESNLSIYFSPNTHLLGEAVALHALGTLFPRFPRARQWRGAGAQVVREQLSRQVRDDGSHFEQSSYYHVYTLDMLLFHGLLAGFDAALREKLARMAEYLDALLSPAGELPLMGDDDGGRFFFPYGKRTGFGASTLATCAILLRRPEWLRDRRHLDDQAAWWLPSLPAADVPGPAAPLGSRLFRDSGLAVMRRDDVQVLADAGPFGPGSAGHSHSDTLSVVVNVGREQVLIDPGTYTYVAAPQWRDRFRGSAAHNTIRIDGLDQAAPAGPFRWREPPRVSVTRWETGAAGDWLEAVCAYRGFRHLRRLEFRDARLRVFDRVEGPPGEHRVEQFWHPGEAVTRAGEGMFAIGARTVLRLEGGELIRGGDFGWRSAALGEKSETELIRVTYAGTLPVEMNAVLEFR